MTRDTAAELELTCDDLDAALALFARLGFRVDVVLGADDPCEVAISGHGTRVRLVRAGAPAATTPPAGLVVSARDDGSWTTGRAGMRYRDLLPGRLGGRVIASHIRIRDGGPVPDYVHYHRVRFQLIFCRRGWVRVVYEDQGPPFVLEPGDCVLQPPGIRHRVLESSPGLEVVELTAPALHETVTDHELVLPTAIVAAERDFGGQRFVHHRAVAAAWRPWRHAGFEARDLGIAAATSGLAAAAVVRARPDAPAETPFEEHAGELLFAFLIAGEATLDGEGARRVHAGDAFAVPARVPFRLLQPTPDLELLEVRLSSGR